MAGARELRAFAAAHGLELLTIADLVAYRRRVEVQVRRITTTAHPTRHGMFEAVLYRGVHDEGEHVALVAGSPTGGEPMTVHLHVACLSGDTLGSSACGCRAALEAALAEVSATGRGVVAYVRPPTAAGGCGLASTPDTETRRWACGIATSMLRDLGVVRTRPLDGVATRPAPDAGSERTRIPEGVAS